MSGTLYLIPTPLGEGPIDYSITLEARSVLTSVNTLVVERAKTARSFIKRLHLERSLDSYQYVTLDKRSKEQDSMDILMKLIQGKDIALMSEAGAPGVADPGSLLVKMAHENKLKVHPLVGPSSFLLALMASGLPGQSFQFHGYLPIDRKERTQKIKQMQRFAQQERQTQIFMETPYRNQALLEALIKTLQPTTQLCIACNLTTQKEWIYTASASDWKAVKKDLQKQPAVFLIY